MERINIRDLWEREWKNAHRFFNSKGNIKTKSRLKDKWYKDFKTMLMALENAITKNLKTQAPKKESDDNGFQKDCYMFMKKKGLKLEFQQFLDKQKYKRKQS